MSGLVNALVIVAVGAMVITRQVRARAIDTDRRWWVLPVVLAVIRAARARRARPPTTAPNPPRCSRWNCSSA